jgi:hypothetical protein
VTLPPLAPVSALETRLGVAAGTLTGADLARAQAALDDASALVRAEAGSPLVDADGTTITAPAGAIAVAIASAKRVYLNPDGLAGYSVEGYSEQQPHGATGVILTSDETAAVAAAMQGVTAGGYVTLGSVRTPSAYDQGGAGDPLAYLWGA